MAMINKNVSSKLLRSLVRRTNSSNITALRYREAQRTTFNAATTNNLPPATKPLVTNNTPTNANANENEGDKIFDFDDTKALFASVSTPKLLHSATTLNLTSVESMVDLSIWVMNSRLMNLGLFREVVLGTIKYTAYPHFVAGADTVETGETCRKLKKSGLRGMLDYGLEHATDNQSCDKATQQLLKTAGSTQSLPPNSVSFFKKSPKKHTQWITPLVNFSPYLICK